MVFLFWTNFMKIIFEAANFFYSVFRASVNIVNCAFVNTELVTQIISLVTVKVINNGLCFKLTLYVKNPLSFES